MYGIVWQAGIALPSVTKNKNFYLSEDFKYFYIKYSKMPTFRGAFASLTDFASDKAADLKDFLFGVNLVDEAAELTSLHSGQTGSFRNRKTSTAHSFGGKWHNKWFLHYKYTSSIIV